MKKILIIQNSILHYRVPLYRKLSTYYDVSVLHSGKEMWPNEPFSEIRVKAKKIGPFYLQSGVLKEIRKKQYSSIVVMFDLRWINNVLAIFFSKPFLVLWGHRYSKNAYSNAFRDFLMKKAGAVLLYDNSEVLRIIASGIHSENIFIANNTIDVPNYSISEKTNKTSFLFVGRAQKRKKVNELIDSFNLILSELPDSVTVDIIGDGVENNILKAKVKELSLEDRVFFHGEIVDSRELKDFFHNALAYVSPGPVGLGVLHSFAYGVPVVTHRDEKHGPEFNHLVDGVNSIIYDKSEDLPEVLLRLSSSGLSRELGENAYNLYSSSLRIENMVQGFVQALNDTERSSE